MSRETVLKIRDAEDAADRLISQAKEQAETMQREAKEQGEQLCKTTDDELTLELSGMLEQIQVRIEEHKERVMNETREEATAVAAAAKLNRKSAEKIVIRGLDAKCR